MKRIFLCLALLGASITRATMYFDAQQKKFFTYPASAEIDQDEYNGYVVELCETLDEMVRSSIFKNYSADFWWGYICANTEWWVDEDGSSKTSDQFIEDLRAIPTLHDFEAIFRSARK